MNKIPGSKLLNSMPRFKEGQIIFLHSFSSGFVRRAAEDLKRENPHLTLKLLVQEDESDLYADRTVFDEVDVISAKSARNLTSNVRRILDIRRSRPAGMVLMIPYPEESLTRRSEVYSLSAGSILYAMDYHGCWYRLSRWGVAYLLLKRIGRMAVNLVDAVTALLLATAWLGIEWVLAGFKKGKGKGG